MYKLMYRIKNTAPNVFAFWGEKQPDGVVKVYEFKNEDDVKKAGRQLAKLVGTDDIRVVQDEDYYLKLIYGVEPTPVPDTYEITLTGNDHIIVEPEVISNIAAEDTVTAQLHFVSDIKQFHLVVNGEEYTEGMPEWITYDDITGIFTFSNITQSYDIQIELN